MSMWKIEKTQDIADILRLRFIWKRVSRNFPDCAVFLFANQM